MMNRRIVGVLILMMTMLAQAQPAANSIDWGFGRPGVRVVTNAPDHVAVTGIASQVSSTLIASHSDVAGMHTTTEQQASWTTAAGWGPHAGLYKALGWLPDWADVQNKPYIPTAQQITDWDTAAGWGPHATAGYLKSATDTVARASIDVLNTGKVSQAQWTNGSNSFEAAIGTLETQRVTRVWSADGTQFVESNVVWQVGIETNYTVALSADFGVVPPTVLTWTTNTWPFTDGDLTGSNDSEGDYVGWFYIRYAGAKRWSSVPSDTYPVMLNPVDEDFSTGTAVVSQHVSTVYNYVKTFAATADLTAVSNLLNGVSDSLTSYANTNLAATTAALQPSVFVRYGDFNTTNTAGYAAFVTANPAQRYITTLRPITNQSLAKARYPIASPMAGTLSLSAYVQSGVPTPAASNSAAYAVLSLYNAGGAVLASNIGATVEIARGAVSNLTASVAIPGTVSSGYIVAEIFSGTNAVNFVAAYAGGSYPMSLFATVSPLGYLTRSEADALYAARNNGTQVNPTMAGTVAMDSRTFAASVDTVTATNGATVSVTYGVFTNGVDFGRCVTYLGTNFWELLK